MAAVKSGLEDAQQGGAAAEGESLQSPKAQGQQQAVGQPRGERQQQQPEEQQESAGVQAALAMLRFYKSAISPLLPPACRFVPTCSGVWLWGGLCADQSGWVQIWSGHRNTSRG